MGQSTDAYFFFGIAWSDEDVYDEVFGPIVDANDASDYDMSKWFAAHNISDVVFDSHCSVDYPMPLLAIEETFVSASRGDPKPVVIRNDFLQDRYRERIEFTLNRLGIHRDEWPEIGWWTASNWG